MVNLTESDGGQSGDRNSEDINANENGAVERDVNKLELGSYSTVIEVEYMEMLYNGV